MSKRFSIGWCAVFLVGAGIPLSCLAQKTTRIQGNTEINASSNNTTAVAVGSNVVAKNRVGVVQGDKKETHASTFRPRTSQRLSAEGTRKRVQT